MNAIKISFLFFLLVVSNTIQSQGVGIGTTSPTAMLDVNGDLKVQATIHETNYDVIRDSILVISKTGKINRVEGTDVINAAIPSMVRATFSNTGNVSHLITLSLGFGYSLVEFDNELIDSNNEFDPTTYTFTAKQDGIYNVSAQIKINSPISISTDFGIGIYKNDVLIAEQSFPSFVVALINITSPIRHVSTVIDLLENDTITFKLSSSLANVNILGNSPDSYCTIYQLR
ncbi:hypothetical protein [Algibacter sp. PT7-4]|uniref:hypothetical protein n=1 Tax=Algibacter ulvanivorans TaxID=3400999 RepID=UPI003AAE26C5